MGKLYCADKVHRVEDVLMDIDAGLFYIPADSTGNLWLSAFFAECQEFTRDDSHEHDDQVDVMVYALQERKSGFVHPAFLGRK